MNVKGYVVRYERDGKTFYVATPEWLAGDLILTTDRGEAGVLFGALPQAVAASRYPRTEASVRIFAVADDGTETPLPTYEEALAERDRVLAATEAFAFAEESGARDVVARVEMALASREAIARERDAAQDAVATMEGELEEARTRSAELEAQLATVTAEHDEARAWVQRLTSAERVLTCAFCGEAYPPGTPESNDDALTAHVRVCPRHPMREVERERDAALAGSVLSEDEARRIARECFAFNVGGNPQDDPPTHGLEDTLIAAFRALSAGALAPKDGEDWIEHLCRWWPGLAPKTASRDATPTLLTGSR